MRPRIKGYYLHYAPVSDVSRVKSGVTRKVFDQINAIRRGGIECEPMLYSQPSSVLGLICSSLLPFPDGVVWPDADSVKDADFIYIRRPRVTSKQLLEFMESYKRVNPNGLILYEMPTYPHDKEMMNPKMYMALLKDRHYRKHLHKYVDRIVDLSGTDEIFGVRTLHIKNGIDFERVSKKRPVPDIESRINIASAAYYYRHHAVERLIEGMREYYSKGGERDILLKIAGEGEEISRYRHLSKADELKGHIEFVGMLDQGQLDELYDSCSLALGSLGIHRVGLKTTSAIKSREYLAKGIPFVYSGGIDVFEEDPVDFCLKVPDNDSPIDVEEMVGFHDALYGDSPQTQIIDAIRSYGMTHVSIDSVMGEVVAYIQNNAHAPLHI